MKKYHMIKGVLGGSDVYDENGHQVGYSLPSVFGDGEDFDDMQRNPVGMSFDDKYGMADFIGTGNGSYGYMDQEILMGQNAYLHGDPFSKPEEPDYSDPFGGGSDSFDPGDGFDSGSGWDE